MPTRHAPTFDLQSHSVHSDGSLTPREVVVGAAAAGVKLLALTDHDTVDGVPEALEAAATQGIRLLPAAELSAVHGAEEDLHILGYGIDPTDSLLEEALSDWRADRGSRIGAMADRLEQLGFTLDRRSLDERAHAGKPLGRPHLAQAVLAHPANRDRLGKEGILGLDALFPAYLVPGAPAYVARTRPFVGEAIEAIHAAGGLAVWAHPFWDFDDPGQTVEIIDAFAALGIDGVECFYITHTAEQTRLLHTRCRARGLLTTGSADFHGPDHERFNAFRAFDLHGLQPDLDRLLEPRELS
ncbi:MAG: PHP domain-containing protein [Solirubrobacterales bacterium]|nr:PHP domain-containing protein [Solirubrobacterales bacterium]